MPEATLANLIAWTEQVFVIAALGWLLPIVFRVRHPRTQLIYGHVVLALCLILPLVEPWRHPVIHRSAMVTTFPNAIPKWTLIVLSIVAAGAVVRFGWLLAGLWQIRRYRIGAMPLYPIPESVRAAAAVTHTDAVLCISPNVTGPVMLGWLTPVILLPESFLSLDEEAQIGIVCHELLHVQRHDWLVTVFEELAGSLLWFNPAVWAVLAQTRLSREELVDSEVVRLTASRDPYIDALLAIARGQSVSDLAPAPAPLFLRRRHLAQRMHSLLKEIPMSKFRLMSSYGSIAVMLAVATWFTVGTFPLVGQPQVLADVPVVTTLQNIASPPTAAPVLRADARTDARRPAGIALQPPVMLPRAGQVRGPSLPLPPDPHELAIGSVQPALTPADRAAALGLLERAEQNSKMHIRTMPAYELKVSFVSGGSVAQTGSGELTETWLNGQNWRWTAALGSFSMNRVASAGRTADANPMTAVPMRIQMLRNAIFWSERAVGTNMMIRTATAQWNGRPVTCLLSSNMPPAVSSARLWEEEERCIDNASGLLQIFSVAPGAAIIYGYSRNQQFHGRAVPDQITIYVGGNVVLEAQVSLTDASPVDPSLFTVTPEMANNGSPIGLRSPERFPMNIGDVSGTARPVIVHATIGTNGSVVEEELCEASEPALGQQALAQVKKAAFSPIPGSQRDAYINVRFGN
jgi:beta-lactamase regulating signal transducer with metallopeptidase domain